MHETHSMHTLHPKVVKHKKVVQVSSKLFNSQNKNCNNSFLQTPRYASFEEKNKNFESFFCSVKMLPTFFCALITLKKINVFI